MNKLIEITEESALDEIINQGGVVLIDFGAKWCGPCRMMTPILEEIAKENDDIKIIKIDTDDCPELAKKFDIRSIPSIHFYVNGESYDVSLGAVPKGTFMEKIEEGRKLKKPEIETVDYVLKTFGQEKIFPISKVSCVSSHKDKEFIYFELRKTMMEEYKRLAEEQGIVIVCESPFELEMEEDPQSRASGQLAYLLMGHLRDLDYEKGRESDVICDDKKVDIDGGLHKVVCCVCDEDLEDGPGVFNEVFNDPYGYIDHQCPACETHLKLRLSIDVETK